MTDHFSRDLAISCAGHLAIVLFVFFSAILAPSERIDIRNAIRVDVVGLPAKMETLPELAPPAPAPAPEPPAKVLPKREEVKEVKTPEPVVPSVKAKKASTEKSEKHALDKLKALEALEKIKKEVSKERSNKPRADVVRGNQVAAGNSLTGLEKIEYDRYFDELSSKIHSQWNIPQWLADADLKAQVLVLLDDRGYILKRLLKKSSGNDIFDAKVLEAVDASSPLPPPPQKLRGLLSTSGIVFNFPQ